ncbi:MAG TPA: ribonuclease P protein component [Terriglobales bacterium]|nr:ribonuclease P protein component [Terriglobales bacterium]
MTDLAPQSAKKSFPKSRHLLRHADFERVYKQGRRHFATHITVFYLGQKEQEAAGPRIGFTVGKALGGAVQRNRIKRRLREAVRLNGFEAGLAVDVVINPKRSVLTMDFSDLQGEVAKAFETIARAMEKSKQQ